MRMNIVGAVCCVVVTVLMGILVASPAKAEADSCGGIINASLTKDKIWAHLDRVEGDNSQVIRVTASESASDEDYDEETEQCDGENHVVIGDTAWRADSGTTTPETGPYTDWKPEARGDSFKVFGMFKDAATPINDDDVEEEIIVKAYEVKVSLQVTDNTGGAHGTVNKTIWEYDTSDSVSWEHLPCDVYHSKWAGTTANDDEVNEDNVHIDWTFEAVPGDADLYGGKIEAQLKTSSSCQLQVDVEDADLVDGSVAFSVGFYAGAPVGFAATVNLEVGSDCAEAVGCAAWGYNSTDGVGATQSPGNNKLERKSSPDDPYFKSAICFELFTPYPLAAWKESHLVTANKSYDTGWVTKQFIKDKVVQAQWTGYAKGETAGDKSGAAYDVEVDDWDVAVYVQNVKFVP